tara:strand:+ start:120 stop:413 length:294 start_codon:yes stop_codon:yes gene_type:complete
MHKPNFCQKCGGHFGPVSAALVEKPDDELTESGIPQLAGLEVDIEIEGPSTIELSKIAGTRNPKDIAADSAVRPNNANNEDIMEVFKKEASTLRKKT